MTSATTPKVLTAISEVMAEMSKEGIAKDNKNSQQNYRFRGIDDIYNALAPVLSKARLVITPRCLTRACEERETKQGGRIAYVTVEVEYDLTSAEDGSRITARTFGEAMDTADKATNKAMSAAYKYMAIQQFCIPTEGDNDADSTTHEVRTSRHLSADEARRAITNMESLSDLEAWNKANSQAIDGLSQDDYDKVGAIYAQRHRALSSPKTSNTSSRQRADADEVFA